MKTFGELASLKPRERQMIHDKDDFNFARVVRSRKTKCRSHDFSLTIAGENFFPPSLPRSPSRVATGDRSDGPLAKESAGKV